MGHEGYLTEARRKYFLEQLTQLYKEGVCGILIVLGVVKEIMPILQYEDIVELNDTFKELNHMRDAFSQLANLGGILQDLTYPLQFVYHHTFL